MANEQRKYYVFCEDRCLFEALTKEQTIAAIAEATGVIPESIDVDAAFITKIKEQNSGDAVKVWVGTEAEFNALETKAPDTLYIYTTDFEEDIINEIEKIKDGTTVVGNAENAAKINTQVLQPHSYYPNNYGPVEKAGLYACVWEEKESSKSDHVYHTEMLSITALNWTYVYSTGTHFYYDGDPLFHTIGWKNVEGDNIPIEVRLITEY